MSLSRSSTNGSGKQPPSASDELCRAFAPIGRPSPASVKRATLDEALAFIVLPSTTITPGKPGLLKPRSCAPRALGDLLALLWRFDMVEPKHAAAKQRRADIPWSWLLILRLVPPTHAAAVSAAGHWPHVGEPLQAQQGPHGDTRIRDKARSMGELCMVLRC